MFSNVGWGEMLLLALVGLVVLGPERLPEAIRWTGQTIRQVRSYLSSATRELREEFGSEFDELREPLGELQKLRGMTPKAAITKHLLDGDDSWITGQFETPAIKPQSAAEPLSGPVSSGTAGGPPTGPAPFDSDAT